MLLLNVKDINSICGSQGTLFIGNKNNITNNPLNHIKWFVFYITPVTTLEYIFHLSRNYYLMIIFTISFMLCLFEQKENKFC